MAYPTLTNLKTHMTVSGSTEDARLTTALDYAVAFFEGYCGRSFVQTTESRYFPVRHPYVFAGKRKLTTYENFDTVTAIVNGDGVAITEYNLVPVNGPSYHSVELKPAAMAFSDGGEGGLVEIDADWEIDTPDDVFQAIMNLARLEYLGTQQGVPGEVQSSSRQSGLSVVQAGLPDNIQMVLDRYKRRS